MISKFYHAIPFYSKFITLKLLSKLPLGDSINITIFCFKIFNINFIVYSEGYIFLRCYSFTCTLITNKLFYLGQLQNGLYLILLSFFINVQYNPCVNSTFLNSTFLSSTTASILPANVELTG